MGGNKRLLMDFKHGCQIIRVVFRKTPTSYVEFWTGAKDVPRQGDPCGGEDHERSEYLDYSAGSQNEGHKMCL